MQVIVNGETKNFDNNFSLQDIIVNLQIENKVMAAAVNMDIVKKENWSNFIPNENDKIELLQFVGGGWLFWVNKRVILLKKEQFHI